MVALEPYFRKGESFQASAHRQRVGSELLTGDALLQTVFSVRTGLGGGGSTSSPTSWLLSVDNIDYLTQTAGNM